MHGSALVLRLCSKKPSCKSTLAQGVFYIERCGDVVMLSTNFVAGNHNPAPTSRRRLQQNLQTMLVTTWPPQREPNCANKTCNIWFCWMMMLMRAMIADCGAGWSVVAREVQKVLCCIRTCSFLLFRAHSPHPPWLQGSFINCSRWT